MGDENVKVTSLLIFFIEMNDLEKEFFQEKLRG
jgi:hypothetical protein